MGSMLPLLVTIFISSLVGSLHCAGMCGAFVAFAVGAPHPERPGSRAALHAAYNLGRLATYMILGTVAGALGAALDLGGSMLGLQRAAAGLAGTLMVLFGVVAILRLGGFKIRGVQVPAFLAHWNVAAHRTAMDWPPVARAGVVGLLTTLLPCGWLYAFVITAAGTAHPLWGAAAMATFWVGTLPMMVSLGVGIQKLSGALGRRLPLFTALAIVLVGLYTITMRMGAQAAVAASALGPHQTPAGLINHVENLDPKNMPCCRDHDK